MQGPFRGIGGALARAFGGPVTVHYGTPDARDVTAVFRKVPRRVDLPGGAEVESLVPILRASREIIATLSEGDLIDPKDGEIYRFLFPEENPNPAADGLVTAQLEEIS